MEIDFKNGRDLAESIHKIFERNYKQYQALQGNYEGDFRDPLVGCI